MDGEKEWKTLVEDELIMDGGGDAASAAGNVPGDNQKHADFRLDELGNQQIDICPPLPFNTSRSDLRMSQPQSHSMPVRVGTADLDAITNRPKDFSSVEESGMLMGPGHPFFSRPRQSAEEERWRIGNGGGSNNGRLGSQFLPPGAVPPGARFDPIYPAGSVRPKNERDWTELGSRLEVSGDPDPDEMQPPGMENAAGMDLNMPGGGINWGRRGGGSFGNDGRGGSGPSSGNPPFF